MRVSDDESDEDAGEDPSVVCCTGEEVLELEMVHPDNTEIDCRQLDPEMRDQCVTMEFFEISRHSDCCTIRTLARSTSDGRRSP